MWSSHVRTLAQTAPRPEARGAHPFCGERFSDRKSARALKKQMWARLFSAGYPCVDADHGPGGSPERLPDSKPSE